VPIKTCPNRGMQAGKPLLESNLKVIAHTLKRAVSVLHVTKTKKPCLPTASVFGAKPRPLFTMERSDEIFPSGPGWT
jgi:hypothetical protein